MKGISIKKHLEFDIWNKELEQSQHNIKFDSGSEYLKAYALIETPHILIGVNYEEETVYPKVKKFIKLDDYFVGIDNRLVIVESKNEKILFQLDLQSFFVDVIEILNKGIIVIEEIGISLYSYTGERLWFTPTDFIESYYIEDESLIVVTDNSKVKLSTSTGKKI